MSKSNKIVCLQVPPGYQEGDYVGKLFRGLSRNTSVPFEFECVTASKYPGWWGKLEVFDPPERVIFLDLDTVITGNVDFLFEYNGPFAILRDFGTPRGDNYGSAVMSISAGYGKQVDRFADRAGSSVIEIECIHGLTSVSRMHRAPDAFRGQGHVDMPDPQRG